MLGVAWSSHVTAHTDWWGVALSPALPVGSGQPTRPYVKASRSKKCTGHSLNHAYIFCDFDKRMGVQAHILYTWEEWLV